MKKQQYTPHLCSPYYGDDRQSGAVLHRYLDDQFLTRFANQAQANQLSLDKHNWLEEDRFGEKNTPCLRLPIHRTFYILCAEACCTAPAYPALPTRRIESAGFVIRQQLDGEVLRWMVRDGLEQGWSIPLNPGIEEPDEYRYLLHKGYTEARSPEPAYSGEQTYPLSSSMVCDTQSKPVRDHNLLYGFVPLGGHSFPTSDQVDKPSLTEVMAELSWPLGTHNTSTWVENSSQHSGHLIQGGKVQQAAAELLAMLFERFHIMDSSFSENAELIALLKTVNIQWGSSGGHDPDAFAEVFGLYDYLAFFRSSVENWLSEYHDSDSDVNAANSKNYLHSHLQLFIKQADANDLRMLLARRTLGTIEMALSDLPEPRYERDGIYYAKVFLRYRDENDCPKIAWGPASVPFRVAAPFDPEASRPHLIQMPGLEDLKRGLANGAAMRTPKSLADVIEKIKPDLGEPGERGSNRHDGGWMYIFSIPILTICAMILLMILVSLLNFIFRWIPWVIMRIPIPK